MTTQTEQKEILVALDGSVLAESVLPNATAVAQANGYSLVLLRVVTPAIAGAVGMLPIPPSVWESWEQEVALARSYLSEVAGKLETAGFSVRAEVVESNPAEAIVHYAVGHPTIAMIAMATHGRSGVGRWFMGSVAEKVLHVAPVPLLLVRAHESQSTQEHASQEMAQAQYNTIVVPLDGSPFAEQALEHAERLASHTGAALVLLAVLPDADALQWTAEGSVPMWFEAATQIEAEGLKNYLVEAAERLRARGLKVRTEVATGDPAEEILRVAEERSSDLIVMATHGRSGVQRLWLGSVAIKVIRGSVRPVLLIRAKERVQQMEMICTQEEANGRAELRSLGNTPTVLSF